MIARTESLGYRERFAAECRKPLFSFGYLLGEEGDVETPLARIRESVHRIHERRLALRATGNDAIVQKLAQLEDALERARPGFFEDLGRTALMNALFLMAILGGLLASNLLGGLRPLLGLG